jgi:hypothetical protein
VVECAASEGGMIMVGSDEPFHRSRWSSASHVAAIGLSLWPTAALSQMSREQTRVSEDAIAILGSHLTAATFLQRCVTAIPDKADDIRQLYSELDAANAGIVALARNKLYALAEIAEGTRGRQKLDAMLGDELQNAIQMQVAAMTNLKSACNGILGRGVEELKTSERYPQERARVLNYKIGYAWGPPGCEYQVVFPVPPEIHTIEANQQPTLQASAREGNMPAITAVCRPLPPGGALAAISQLKTGGMRTLEDSGVKNIRLQEQTTQKGYELNATGEKSVEGTDMIVTTVFYLGKTSLLEVAITESASVTPSLIATQFLDWIDRPNLKR